MAQKCLRFSTSVRSNIRITFQRQWIKEATMLLKIKQSIFMIYLYDSLAFCRKSFNKFRVISCLWYQSERERERKTTKNWSKNLLRQFFKCKFFRKEENEWTHCQCFFTALKDGDEKMKTVIKMIITVSDFNKARDEARRGITKLSTFLLRKRIKLIIAESADVWSSDVW